MIIFYGKSTNRTAIWIFSWGILNLLKNRCIVSITDNYFPEGFCSMKTLNCNSEFNLKHFAGGGYFPEVLLFWSHMLYYKTQRSAWKQLPHVLLSGRDVFIFIVCSLAHWSANTSKHDFLLSFIKIGPRQNPSYKHPASTLCC